MMNVENMRTPGGDCKAKSWFSPLCPSELDHKADYLIENALPYAGLGLFVSRNAPMAGGFILTEMMVAIAAGGKASEGRDVFWHGQRVLPSTVAYVTVAPEWAVRRRLRYHAEARGVGLPDLDLQVIRTVPKFLKGEHKHLVDAVGPAALIVIDDLRAAAGPVALSDRETMRDLAAALIELQQRTEAMVLLVDNEEPEDVGCGRLHDYLPTAQTLWVGRRSPGGFRRLLSYPRGGRKPAELACFNAA
jgi:hypothetical protein